MDEQHVKELDKSIDWIFKRLRRPPLLWHLASSITIATVGFLSKVITAWLNRTRIYNDEILASIIDTKPQHVPLLTLSNHHSCFDDPGIWGILPIRQNCNFRKIRWSLAAHDICFTKQYHSHFFMYGKCIPVIRGGGVYQQAVDLCIEKLAIGDWVHIFPEGKVNMTKENLRFKWGIGRMIYESPVAPIIVPIWHEGMDTVLPNYPPYIIKFGKKITINVGQPINISDLVDSLKKNNTPEPEARKIITDRLQNEMNVLRQKTEKLHAV